MVRMWPAGPRRRKQTEGNINVQEDRERNSITKPKDRHKTALRGVLDPYVSSGRAVLQTKMNQLVRTLGYLCLGWTVLYLLWGGTSAGKAWFTDATKTFFDNYKGGMPFLVLALPILFATVASVAFYRREETTPTISRCLPGSCLRLYRSCQLQLLAGDAMAPRIVSWSFLACLGCYIAASLERKVLAEDDASLDYQLMEVANIFGITGLIAMCILLVPVTEYSPLVKVFGMSASTAMALHKCTGRFVVLACLAHGIMHIFRWTAIAKENFTTMILPPMACWTMPEEDEEPTICAYDTDDCDCINIFQNLVGFVAVVGLALVGVSSLEPFRRRLYWLFYRIHVIAGPIVFIGVILHWHRSVMYLAGGLLYYLAMYVGTHSERAASQGVKLVSTKRLQGHDAASFICLTLQADARTVRSFQPTQYVKLKVPEISAIAHPFSINRVPSEPQKMRLIVREGGEFTRTLADRCMDDNKPSLYLSGFFGTETRGSDIEQHDVVVIVAGGIGITTYLTLLKDTVQKFGRPDRRLNKIVLHWICREAHLIDYIQREYLDDISNLFRASSGISLQITIHRTGLSSLDANLSFPKEGSKEPEVVEYTPPGQPFSHSRYTLGVARSFFERLPLLFTILSMSMLGLCGLWYLYMQYDQPLWVLCYLGLLFLGMRLVLHIGFILCWKRDEVEDVLFVPIQDSDNEIEMENVKDGLDSLSAGGIQRRHVPSVSIEESEGRPSIHSLLNPLEEAKYPSIFLCGPSRLMNAVRKEALGRCRMRLQRCVCGEPRIALYQEAFEM